MMLYASSLLQEPVAPAAPTGAARRPGATAPGRRAPSRHALRRVALLRLPGGLAAEPQRGDPGDLQHAVRTPVIST